MISPPHPGANDLSCWNAVKQQLTHSETRREANANREKKSSSTNFRREWFDFRPDRDSIGRNTWLSRDRNFGRWAKRLSWERRSSRWERKWTSCECDLGKRSDGHHRSRRHHHHLMMVAAVAQLERTQTEDRWPCSVRSIKAYISSWGCDREWRWDHSAEVLTCKNTRKTHKLWDQGRRCAG